MKPPPKKQPYVWLIRGVLLIGLMLVLVTMHALPTVQARGSDQDALRSHYPQLVGTRLDSCALCHTSGSRLNSYGRDYARNGGDFARLEPLDSDGDGFPNGAEIAALTLPGDAGDVPTTEPTPPPAAPTVPPAAPGAPPPRLPVERIDARFQTAWERGGGLEIYGLPLTDAYTVDSGLIVQYFERARFEYHPELASTPNAILLGRLGVELGHTQPPLPPPAASQEQPWYFAATGHTIAEPFRTFWSTRGGLLTFGYPIGAAFIDNNGMLMQYFERARMERHSNPAGTGDVVLLGFLGEEALQTRQQPARPEIAPTPQPAPAPTQPPRHDDDDEDHDDDHDDDDDEDDHDD